MADERGSDAAGYLGWFFLGAIVGGAAALLLAPKTGRETRELLAEHGGEAWRSAQEKAGDVQHASRRPLRQGPRVLRGADAAADLGVRGGKSAMKEEMGQGRLDG